MQIEWHPNLVAMGYKAPLAPPIPAIQAMLSAIQNLEIHDFVQQSALATFEAAGDESETALLLFSNINAFHETKNS